MDEPDEEDEEDVECKVKFTWKTGNGARVVDPFVEAYKTCNVTTSDTNLGCSMYLVSPAFVLPLPDTNDEFFTATLPLDESTLGANDTTDTIMPTTPSLCTKLTEGGVTVTTGDDDDVLPLGAEAVGTVTVAKAVADDDADKVGNATNAMLI